LVNHEGGKREFTPSQIKRGRGTKKGGREEQSILEGSRSLHEEISRKREGKEVQIELAGEETFEYITMNPTEGGSEEGVKGGRMTGRTRTINNLGKGRETDLSSTRKLLRRVRGELPLANQRNREVDFIGFKTNAGWGRRGGQSGGRGKSDFTKYPGLSGGERGTWGKEKKGGNHSYIFSRRKMEKGRKGKG